MNQLFKKILISAIVGFIYFYLVKIFWGYFPNINPITNGLLSCCAAEPWIRSVIYIHDLLINALLCVPLAIFIYRLKPQKISLCVAAAIIPSFAFGSYHLFHPELWGTDLSIYVSGWLLELLCLPIALLLILFWVKRENT